MTADKKALNAWEDFKTATYWNDLDNTQERAIDLFKCDTVIAIENALTTQPRHTDEVVMKLADLKRAKEYIRINLVMFAEWKLRR